ncbi:MAG TPA: VCBS repeat-containing protein [Nannocystaceae bacterium]|nr:VCBS repeat-containing protein [Nannocystaceae bacterium]
MRPAVAATLLALFAPACFDGKDAHGLPCREDHQCGLGERCEGNVCGGPAAATQSDTQADTQTDTQTDTGTSARCDPPPPAWCGASTTAGTHMPRTNEFSRPELTRPAAVVAGDFRGDASTDLVVLSQETFRLNMLSNEDDEWMVRGTSDDVDGIQTARDLIATDRDCDGTIEFAVLSTDGHIALVNWDEPSERFVSIGAVDVAGAAHSFAVGDLVDDDMGYPDLVVSSNAVVSLVTNIDGMFDQQSVDELMLGDEFYQPWDTVILDEDDDPRIVAPSADGRKQFQQYDHVVHLLHVAQAGDGAMLEDATPAVLASDFRNPWAIAQGDFDGDGGLEIAVVERNVNSDDDGTNEPGRLRFFYLEAVDAFPVFEGGIELGIGPLSLEAADLDCDGFTDLVVGNGGAPPGLPGSPQIVFGQADLATATVTDIAAPSGAFTPGTRTAVGDFDGDGRPEVAIPDAGFVFSEAGERIVFVGVEGT